MKKKRPACEYCGTPNFLVKTIVPEGYPDSAIHVCARCDDTIHHGTELQRAALLLQSLELLTRQANEETIKLLPGLTRNQRRRLLRECEADMPERLEHFIQTAPGGLLDCLKTEART